MPSGSSPTAFDYAVDLRSSDGGADDATTIPPAAAWLIGAADGLIAGAADPSAEAAAIQVAVWQLTGQAADVAEVTPDASLNARVAELRALASGRSPGGPLALTIPPGATAGVPVAVAISGSPGAVVRVEVTGPALPASASVTLDAAGGGEVVVTPSAAGEVAVTASAPGGVAWRASHLPGEETPQDIAWVSPVEVSARATLPVAAAPVVTPPVAPPVAAPVAVPVAAVPAPVAQVPARLKLVKRAPRRVRAGRIIVYRLTVTNRSPRVARGVVVRDRLPRGTFLPRRPARGLLRGGAVVWRLGTLRPGARVTVRLRLRTVRSRSGRLVNVARASASNAATVRARAVTRVRPVRRPVRPAVVAPAVTG